MNWRRRYRSRDSERDRDRDREERYRNREGRYSNDGEEISENNSRELSIREENNFNVDNIPDITLENITELNDENKICSICLEEYKNNDKIKKLDCNHIFHSECVKIWLSNKTTCPICRTDLRQSN